MDRVHGHEPPRVALARLPTPLCELPNLAAELRVPRVLIKRDDLTGLETTGNKIRKLEYLLADALAQGCDTLVTLGAWQSNHCRATAAVGARLGFRVKLILRAPTVDAPSAGDAPKLGDAPKRADPPSLPDVPNVGNLLLDRLFGADISMHPAEQYAARRTQIVEATLAELRNSGRKPYFFGVGGSTPLGAWGYIRAMHELAAQLPRGQPFDLFLAVSSAGTLAGAIIGKRLLGLEHLRIVGVPVSDHVEHFRREVIRHIDQCCQSYDLGFRGSADDLHLLDGFVGRGYAIPTESSLEALKLVARREGILLDPVYTAKAMDGMIAAIRRGQLRPGAVPVFLHTGGVFGLMAWADLFNQDSTNSRNRCKP